jgi:hypothetical protein
VVRPTGKSVSLVQVVHGLGTGLGRDELGQTVAVETGLPRLGELNLLDAPRSPPETQLDGHQVHLSSVYLLARAFPKGRNETALRGEAASDGGFYANHLSRFERARAFHDRRHWRRRLR